MLTRQHALEEELTAERAEHRTLEMRVHALEGTKLRSGSHLAGSWRAAEAGAIAQQQLPEGDPPASVSERMRRLDEEATLVSFYIKMKMLTIENEDSSTEKRHVLQAKVEARVLDHMQVRLADLSSAGMFY